MNLDAILELTWVPIIVLGISLGYGIVLLTTKDPKILVGKNNKKIIKDRTKYAVECGKLLLFLAAGSALMCVLLFVNLYLAFGQILLWLILFGGMWKRVTDNYGPV